MYLELFIRVVINNTGYLLLSELECMGKDCNVLMPEDFVLSIVTNPRLRDKYQEYGFRDHVKVGVCICTRVSGWVCGCATWKSVLK